MKCRNCTSCAKGWFSSRPSKYVCIGVKEPFVINDINQECTEYSKEQWEEWGEKPKTIKTNADHIRSMNNEELAKFLMSRWFVDDVCEHCEGEYDRCGDEEFCESKILEWLLKNVF